MSGANTYSFARDGQGLLQGSGYLPDLPDGIVITLVTIAFLGALIVFGSLTVLSDLLDRAFVASPSMLENDVERDESLRTAIVKTAILDQPTLSPRPPITTIEI